MKAGDIIVAKGKDDEGFLLSNGHVQVNGVELSMQKWLKSVCCASGEWKDAFPVAEGVYREGEG